MSTKSEMEFNFSRVIQALILQTLTYNRCFQCWHCNNVDMDDTWTDLHNQAYQSYSQPDIITVSSYMHIE